MRVLIASNMIPGPRAPYYGVFVRRQAEALAAYSDMDVEVIGIADPRKGRLRSPLKYGRFFAELIARIATFRPDVVHFHYAVPTAVLGPVLEGLTGLRYVVTLHGGDVYEMPDRLPGGLRGLRSVLGHARQLIVVSERLREDLEARLPGLHVPTSVIHMGVDEAPLRVVTPGPVHRLAFIGQLIERKGVDLLIDAMSTRPELELELTGDGPARADLEHRARELGLVDRVRFLGRARPEEIASRLEGRGTLVVPSRREPLGLVALEGMAAGLVVVAAQTGGLAEIVVDRETGLGFAPDDADALGRALDRVMQMDPADIGSLRSRARDSARAQSVKAQAERTREVLLAAQSM